MVLPEFESTVRELPGVHVIALHGELDMSSAECVDEALAGIEGSTVVVDLSRLTFMDSTGITALVGARNWIMDDGLGQLVLSRPVCAVRKVLEITGLCGWIAEWSADWDSPSSSGIATPDAAGWAEVPTDAWAGSS